MSDYEYIMDDNQAAPTPAPEKPEPPENQHLKLARQQMDEYENRINMTWRSDNLTDRAIHEDRAYKRAMMHAAYANAEAATRQAEVAESFLEFVAEFIADTDLAQNLIQWGYRQK